MESGFALTCRGEPPCPVDGRGDEGTCRCGTAAGGVSIPWPGWVAGGVSIPRAGMVPSTQISFAGGSGEAPFLTGDSVLVSAVPPWPGWVAV